MVLLPSDNGDLGYKRMLNQDSSSEVVPIVSTPLSYNMQQYGVQQPCGMQFYSPPATYIYSEGGGSVLPSDISSRPQWQESGYVSTPGNYLPQQSGGPTGGANPQIRLGLQPGPPQQGPPPTQPTPTSTPPGALLDMKPNSHIPGQMQQGIDIGGLYVQSQPRPPTGSQSFHPNSYQPVRIPPPVRRNTQVAMPSNNVPSMYQIPFNMMVPPVMMNVQSYPAQNYPNPRHQGQNSNTYFSNPPSILVGHAPQGYYGAGGGYFPPVMRQYPSTQGTGPAPQTGAPQGPVATLTSVQTGMVQAPQQPIPSSQEPKKSRQFAIPIIDPITGINIVTGQLTTGNNNNITPPTSNDSSARETPQPVSPDVQPECVETPSPDSRSNFNQFNPECNQKIESNSTDLDIPSCSPHKNDPSDSLDSDSKHTVPSTSSAPPVATIANVLQEPQQEISSTVLNVPVASPQNGSESLADKRTSVEQSVACNNANIPSPSSRHQMSHPRNITPPTGSVEQSQINLVPRDVSGPFTQKPPVSVPQLVQHPNIKNQKRVRAGGMVLDNLPKNISLDINCNCGKMCTGAHPKPPNFRSDQKTSKGPRNRTNNQRFGKKSLENRVPVIQE